MIRLESLFLLNLLLHSIVLSENEVCRCSDCTFHVFGLRVLHCYMALLEGVRMGAILLILLLQVISLGQL